MAGFASSSPALVLVLTVIGFLQVLFRYVINSSLSWTAELSGYLLIWLVLLAAAAEVSRGGHIAMHIAIDHFPPALQLWVKRFSAMLILVFALIMMVYGLDLAQRTMTQEATTLPITMGEVYLAVPVAGLLIAINAIRLLLAAAPPVHADAAPDGAV